ncbi:MAG: amidohydrolase family protein, partial [Pseudobdellovibrio sp.]
MKKIILLTISFLSSISIAQTAAPDTLILVGQMPGRYFKDVNAHSYVMGYIEMKNRVIQKVAQIKEADLATFEKQNAGKQILKLKREGQSSYDVIYPGLINLHNHTKQNNIPVWGSAQGQFANRFEWRDWPNYKYSVSGNMNPWVDYARAVECATFRWSELSALVLGTTYLQGPSSCVENFGIQRVEDASSYISPKAAVQAPTDLVMPAEMEFVWNTLGPIIRTGKTYEFALAETIKKYCPTIAATEQNVNSPEMLKILKDQVKLTELCAKENLPAKFIRYVYWIHPTISGRKNYFANKKSAPSAVIAHLAEGRRDDEYNKKEYEIVKMLGLDVAKMNFVHGVGIPSSDYPELAKKDIGLIWSPFSNLILYSQTLDIAAALKSGVTVAIGSDWVPTGTKSVLEEVKVARNYII